MGLYVDPRIMGFPLYPRIMGFSWYPRILRMLSLHSGVRACLGRLRHKNQKTKPVKMTFPTQLSLTSAFRPVTPSMGATMESAFGPLRAAVHGGYSPVPIRMPTAIPANKPTGPIGSPTMMLEGTRSPSPVYRPTSPEYGLPIAPRSPSPVYRYTSPEYDIGSPIAPRSPSPDYNPTSPVYKGPDYTDMDEHAPVGPEYTWPRTTSPAYNPTSPAYKPTSPAYRTSTPLPRAFTPIEIPPTPIDLTRDTPTTETSGTKRAREETTEETTETPLQKAMRIHRDSTTQRMTDEDIQLIADYYANRN